MDIHIKELKTEIYEEQRRSPNLIGDFNMSCISNNFSSFFLDSLNDPSEFAKYLGNAENKAQSIDEQVFCTTNGGGGGNANSSIIINSGSNGGICSDGDVPIYNNDSGGQHHIVNNSTNNFIQHQHNTSQQQQQHQQQQHHQPPYNEANNINVTQFDSSFDFAKYLKHSEYGETTTTPPNNHLIDLDSTPPNRTTTATAANNTTSLELDTFDNDSKNNIFDVHNSNESTGMSDQRTSSNTSECSDSSNQTNASKPLLKFAVKENFDVHQAHKVEEGIFQHMNKLPNKKKDILKQLGVTFTGHMSVNDKSIIVDNFTKFCEDYGINDHRPFLSLNQSGMPKPEQIKFARYLGQGLPHFTLFCIYSNFKNLFCTKRFENYAKGTYNLQYILDKTKRFLTCSTADLKTLTPQMCDGTDVPMNNNSSTKQQQPQQENTRLLEKFAIFENFDVHESHRIEDGIFTHISRLSPKKQELLKTFGIQSNHTVTYSEKHIIIDNFIKFSTEYSITDHRPFLDFQENGLAKVEQIKFARYLGQGLPNLTLYKIYSAFKDLLALNRIEKLINSDGYNLDVILKKKKKNLLNRINAAATKEKQAAEAAAAQVKLETVAS